MILADKLDTPGEHHFMVTGLVGELEAVLNTPANASRDYLALLGHPHSLQGGTMNNKVVTTMARVCKEMAIPSLRFNFRGVGQSEGNYDEGRGESEDMLALMRLCQQEIPEIQFILAGFSFGSYVAYRAAALGKAKLLITVAPPVHHYNYHELTLPHPWVILQGDDDEIVPLPAVLEFAASFSPPLVVHRFAKTSHFFHGKLLELKEQLIRSISQYVVK